MQVDVICGTSTGGLLALMLADGYSPQQIKNIYWYHLVQGNSRCNIGHASSCAAAATQRTTADARALARVRTRYLWAASRASPLASGPNRWNAMTTANKDYTQSSIAC